MIHEVAAHQAAGAVEPGREHQPRVLDRVRAQDEDARPHAARRMLGRDEIVVGLVLDLAHAAGVRVQVDLRGDGLGQEVHAAVLGSALASVRPALYLACTGQSRTQLMLPWQRPLLDLVGAHRALRREAAPAVVRGVRDAVAALWEGADAQLVRLAVELDVHPVDALGHHLVQVGQRQAPHREHVPLAVGHPGTPGPRRRRTRRSPARPARSRTRARRSRAASRAPGRSGYASRSPREASAGSCPPGASSCRPRPGCRWCRWRAGPLHQVRGRVRLAGDVLAHVGLFGIGAFGLSGNGDWLCLNGVA